MLLSSDANPVLTVSNFLLPRSLCALCGRSQRPLRFKVLPFSVAVPNPSLKTEWSKA
jgi:hypothetical protein